MQIILKASGIEHTNAIDTYVVKKLAELDKVLDPNDASIKARVEIAKETKHHKRGADVYNSQVSLRAWKKIFKVNATDDQSLYAAIDAMKDQIVRDVKEYKARMKAITKKGERIMKRSVNENYK
jgi:ribosomal subunit interface protein